MKTAFLFAAALVAAPALAQSGDPGPGRGPMGAGSDQPMKRADVETRTKERFTQMDANGDGVLTGDELPGRMAQFIDTDGDGKVTLDEMVGMALKRFDAADANKDGVVTPEERAGMRGRDQ